MGVVKIEAAEYGLEEVKAKQIAKQFTPMLDKMQELETELNEVNKMETSPEKCGKAKELRLKYVKIRTGVAGIHKEQKAFFLAGGRFVDGWKNAQIFASQGVEENLLSIEKHFDNIEKEKRETLQASRAKKLESFKASYIPSDLGIMEAEVWENYLKGVELADQQRKEAELKAEAERVAKEKAEAEEQTRIIKENERLKKEAEDKEKADKRAKEARAKEEAKRLNEERIERERVEAERAKENAERAKKEQEETAKREALEAELKAKEEAEARTKEEEAKRLEAELRKGDAAKVIDLLADLTELKFKFSFKSKKNKKMYQDVSTLIDKVINHIG